MIQQLIAEYVQFASSVKNDTNLNLDVKSKIMLEQAQALAQLVPIANGPEAELQMKQQEMQVNLEMKRQELAMKQQEHQLKLQQTKDSHVMKLQQAQETHAQKLSQQPKENMKKSAQSNV